MPKVELHLHLEGSIRAPTARSLAARHGRSYDESSQLGFVDFDGFLAAFLAGLDLLRSAEDFVTVTEALARELADQHVVYAEVTTTPFNHYRRGVDMAAYTEGLDEGRRRAAGHGVAVNWILDIPRELEPPDAQYTAGFILDGNGPDGVIGIGLGGPESGWPAELFEASFSRVRAAGLAGLPHAGETEGPASVWAAVERLGAVRIGHGVRSVEDPRLLDHLAAHDVLLEISMTSNVCTGVVPSVEAHPVRELTGAGIPVCFNTDDPAYFFTSLTAELELAQRHHGFSAAELAATQQMAMDRSFAGSDIRAAFAKRMRAWNGAA